MDEIQIGVVVLNWNRPDLTIACLDSILAAADPPRKIVLVDNDSDDDSVARFREWAAVRGIPYTEYREGRTGSPPPVDVTHLTIIVADSNRGFACGNNLGIRFLRNEANFTHILLLNNDATVARDFFEELGKALAIRPDAGLLTGTIYVAGGSTPAVWYAGGIEIPFRALTAHLNRVPEDEHPRPTEFVCGCSMLISRQALDMVGELAECYAPFYGEDAEYSLRVREAGLPVIYAPRAAVYHQVGGTVGPARESPQVTYSQNRHRVFFVRRNYRGAKKVVALGYLLATKPARALVEVLRGEPKLGRAIFMGFASGLLSPAAHAE